MSDAEMTVELKPNTAEEVHTRDDFERLSLKNILAWRLNKQYGASNGLRIYQGIRFSDYPYVWGRQGSGSTRHGGQPEFIIMQLPHKIELNPEYAFYTTLIDIINQTKANPFASVCVALSCEQIDSLRNYLTSISRNDVWLKLEGFIRHHQQLKKAADQKIAADEAQQKKLVAEQVLNARRAELRAFFERHPDNAKTYVFNADDTLLGEHYIVRSAAYELFLISVDTYDFYRKLNHTLSDVAHVVFDSINVAELISCSKIVRYDVPIEINSGRDKPYYFLGSETTVSSGLKKVSISGQDLYFHPRPKSPYFTRFGGRDPDRYIPNSSRSTFVEPKELRLPIVAPPVIIPPVVAPADSSSDPPASSVPVLPSVSKPSSVVSTKSPVLSSLNQPSLFLSDKPSSVVLSKHETGKFGSKSDSVSTKSNQATALAALATSLIFFFAAAWRYKQIKQGPKSSDVGEELKKVNTSAKKWLAACLFAAASAGVVAGGLYMNNKQ